MTQDAAPQASTGEVKVTVAEEGHLRASVCVERTLGDSRFRQWITLREGAQADRIDLVNDIDWQSSNALLKAEFPLSVSNPEAVYDLGVGSVARGNNTATAYEVYAQQWADLTDADGSYGVSVLNDSKYGWDKPADNTLRLTLLHTPATKGGYAYQNKQDFGHHTFTYSIVGHAGDYRAGGAVRRAEVLNQPLRAFVAPRHGGVLGRSFSLASSQNPNVALRALKQAEDSDEYVVRFYETSGLGSQQAVVGFAAQIVDARELNGVEDVVGDAEFCGRELRFEVGVLDLKDVQLDLLTRQLLELDAQAVGLCTTATDDDARTSGVQVDANAVTRALDAHLGDAGALEVVGQELADRDVFGHVIRVALSLGGGVGEPARPVVSGDSQTEPAGVDLLTHISGLPSSCLPWSPPRW